MKLLTTIIVAAVCMVGTLPNASAAPARFWISTSKTSPIVPEAPTINAPQGKPVSLYIWAQPATDGGGMFRILNDFSLDVATLDEAGGDESAPFIDFLDGTYKVYNATVPGEGPRFQFVADSQTSASNGGPLTSEQSATNVMAGYADAINGIVGISSLPPFIAPSAAGVGNASDPNRVVAGNSPAWLIAELGFQSLQSSGTNALFLQIGHFGMEHEGLACTPQQPACTQVVFGNNATPIYTAGPGNTERQTTLPGDTFDVRINAIPFVPGDYNSDGSVGPVDYQAWRSSSGATVIPGAGADGNNNGVIDAADYVYWRKRSAAGAGSGLSTSVPEPATASPALLCLFVIGRLARCQKSKPARPQLGESLRYSHGRAAGECRPAQSNAGVG